MCSDHHNRRLESVDFCTVVRRPFVHESKSFVKFSLSICHERYVIGKGEDGNASALQYFDDIVYIIIVEGEGNAAPLSHSYIFVDFLVLNVRCVCVQVKTDTVNQLS